jgi:SH3 domain protein
MTHRAAPRLWRRPSILLGLGLAALGLLATSQASAETYYVSDHCEVPLRAGESLKYKVRRTLSTGTPLEILGRNDKSGYSRVKTTDGLVGFVASDQLQVEPVARDQVAGLEAKVQELEARFAALPPSLQEVQVTLDATLADKRRLEEELLSIRQAAGDAPRILRERGELRQTVADLTRQVAELEQINRELDHSNNQRWFLIGGGVIVGGILLGFFLPQVRFGRRSRTFDSRI